MDSVVFGRIGASGVLTPMTARSYVQDGLVVHFDGLENAGYGKYDESASAWTNLVDGRRLNFASGWTWENGWARSNYHTAGSITFGSLQSCTIEFCTEILDGVKNSSLITQAPSGNLFAYFITGASYLDFRTRLFPTSEGNCAGLEWTGSNKFGVVRTITGQNDKAGNCTRVFLNGDFVTIGKVIPESYTGLRIAGNTGADWRICSLRVYSRALTAAEVARNYKIDRLRFNLTEGAA